MNNFVAWGILTSITVAIINAIIVEPIDYVLADGLYTLAGLGLVVFGSWAAVILLRK